jgi:hypothetical protein
MKTPFRRKGKRATSAKSNLVSVDSHFYLPNQIPRMPSLTSMMTQSTSIDMDVNVILMAFLTLVLHLVIICIRRLYIKRQAIRASLKKSSREDCSSGSGSNISIPVLADMDVDIDIDVDVDDMSQESSSWETVEDRETTTNSSTTYATATTPPRIVSFPATKYSEQQQRTTTSIAPNEKNFAVTAQNESLLQCDNLSNTNASRIAFTMASSIVHENLYYPALLGAIAGSTTGTTNTAGSMMDSS